MKRFLLIMFLMFSSQVSAHKSSDAYINIVDTDDNKSVQIFVSIRDIEYAVGLDLNADNKITWSELLQRKQVIESYVMSRISFYSIKSEVLHPCAMTVDSMMIDNKSDGRYIVLAIEVPCLSEKSVDNFAVDYRLLFDIDINHRGLISFQSNSNNISRVASPDDHFINIEKDVTSKFYVLRSYIVEGVWHILIGLDHILFLIALLLPSVLRYEKGRWIHRDTITSSLVPIVKIVTAFTVAHSITLTLSVLQIMVLPVQTVEVIIAVTVLLTCLHTLKPVFKDKLWQLALAFGLIHGFGFANVLLDLGLSDTALALSLLGFNIGVEIGQLLIVAAFLLVAAFIHQYWWYRVFIFRGGILATALLSCIWIVERSLNYEILT